MKTILEQSFNVEGFSCIEVKMVEWLVSHENDQQSTAIIGVCLKGNSVNSETKFKSIQGLFIENYEHFDRVHYVTKLIETGIYTTPLSSPTLLDTKADTFEMQVLSKASQTAFDFGDYH